MLEETFARGVLALPEKDGVALVEGGGGDVRGGFHGGGVAGDFREETQRTLLVALFEAAGARFLERGGGGGFVGGAGGEGEEFFLGVGPELFPVEAFRALGQRAFLLPAGGGGSEAEKEVQEERPQGRETRCGAACVQGHARAVSLS